MAPAPKRIKTYGHTNIHRAPERPDIYEFVVSPSPSPVKKKKQPPTDTQSQPKKRLSYEEAYSSPNSNAHEQKELRRDMSTSALPTIWSPSHRLPALDPPLTDVAAAAVASHTGSNEELGPSARVGNHTGDILEEMDYVEEGETMHEQIDSDAYASDGSFHFVRTGKNGRASADGNKKITNAANAGKEQNAAQTDSLEPPVAHIQTMGTSKPSRLTTKAQSNALPKASPKTKHKKTKDKNIYKVEFIISHWVDAKGRVSLRVKWEGYDKPRDATWEPEESLREWVPDLIDEYYESIGGRDSLLSKSRRSANRCFATLADGDTKFKRSWEVKKIVDQRITAEGTVEYKIRWRGCTAEEDEWKGLGELGHAQKLVAAFSEEAPSISYLELGVRAVEDRYGLFKPPTKLPKIAESQNCGILVTF